MTDELTARLSRPRAAARPASPRFVWSDLWRGVPTPVWLVTALFGALLVGWSILTPYYQSADEPKHVDRAIAASEGHVLIPPKGRMEGLGVQRSVLASGIPHCCPPPVQPYDLKKAPPHDQRKSIVALGESTPTTDVNQLTAHPPLYYLWEGFFYKALPGGWPYDRMVEALRLASALLVLPLPLLLYAAARRFAGQGPVAVAASVLPLGIPQLTHLGAAVTNDDLLVLMGGLVTVLVAYVLTGDTSRRTAAWLGVVLALTLLTKGFGFFALPAAALAYAVAWLRAHRDRTVLVSGGVALAVALVGGGWYWLRNLVLYGHVQPDGGAVVPPPAPPTWHASAYDYFAHGYPDRMWTSFFGNFGWLAYPVPGLLVGVSLALVVLGLILALRSRPQPATPWSWMDVVVLVLPITLIYWGVGVRAYHGYVLRASLGANQGRYLYLGLAGMLVAAALGLRRLPVAARRWAPLGALVLVAVAQLVGVHVALDGWYGVPGHGLFYKLHDMVAWSVFTGSELAGLVAVAAVIAAGTVVTVVRYGAARPVRGRHGRLLSAPRA